MSKTVSLNGQPGSYHEQVFTENFLSEDKAIYCENFKEVFNNVTEDRSSFGLVAIENALYGSINEVDALLFETGLQIIEEYYLRINLCLIGLGQTEFEIITDVYSQNIALAQCHIWLDKNLPTANLHDIGDTAGSVAYVKAQNDPSKVALASSRAAELYGMKVLDQNLENDQKNFTRFVLITKNPHPSQKATKTSINLIVTHKPGSLHEVLGIFKDLQINLTKLDSKPIPGKPWEYMFFIDFEAGIFDESTIKLFSELEANGHKAHVLRSYIAASAPKS